MSLGVLAGEGQKGHSRPKLHRRSAICSAPPLPDGDIVDHSTLFRHAAAIICTATTLSLPSALAAQAPTSQELAHSTRSGSYLAARQAGSERDSAAAAAYYRNALKLDPHNNELLSRTFLSVLTEGDVEEAAKLAERVVQADRNDRIARLVLGLRALRVKQYVTARTNLAQSVRGPVTDLTATLLSAWALYGAGETRGAIEAIDKLAGPEWYGIFKDLHAGMILDAANNKKEAGKRYERAYKADPNALRTVEAYGRWLSRNGSKADALRVYTTFDKALPRHPLITQAIKEISAGEKLPPLVDSAQSGAAEALYGLGASIGRRGGEDLALVYLELALYLSPSHPMALLSLADLYESLKKPELALKVYERMPASSPLRRNSEIQLATDLDSLDRTDEAKKRLEHLVSEHPKDTEAILALGNILRGRKQFAECADVYSKAIATVPQPEKSNWVTFYFRGICYERSKQWPKAEADLKKALELFPDQPLVLNYLGYSWVDQGLNLDDGMKMIRRAVDQRPDDGYIVDSLGWAYFRIANYPEAVKNLERAVELKPEDPTINDHLGDAYWKVGRTLEARFQWNHARDLNPDKDDLPKIEAKIKDGLPEDTSSSADAEKAKKPGNGG
jgi:tetratricopeptide (TPR) repeat protein